jgi:outer membrane protein OmpA-like peptidoglycan-associated protein
MDKFPASDIFSSREERSTVLIACLVLLFFGWLIYHLGFSSDLGESESPTAISEQSVEDKSNIANPEISVKVEFKESASPSLEDRDKDGVYDANDACPNTIGTKENAGCPIIELEDQDKATLEFAVRAVQFRTDKARLKTNSIPILNDILSILKKYPDFHLRIEGHTDSQGNAARNLQLSKGRAATCYEFFTTRGISANRLEYQGYGETRPLAPNNTPAGRATNRRVEFNMHR